MEISQQFAVNASPEAVWDAMKDFKLVASCLPGAHVQDVDASGTRCRGGMKLRLGPIAVGFAGEATVTHDEAAMSAEVRGKGADPKTSSRAQMQMSYQVEAAGEGAIVRVHAQISLSGILAQFSKGPVVNEVAAQITRDFAAELQNRLVATAAAPSASGEPPVVQARQAAGLNPLRLLWRMLVYRVRQAFSGSRAQ